MFHPDCEIHMWGYRVDVEVMPTSTVGGHDFIEIHLGIPDSLHQRFENSRPLQLITEGQAAVNFLYSGYDEERRRNIWSARVTPQHGHTFSLMYGKHNYASWKVNDGQVNLMERPI